MSRDRVFDDIARVAGGAMSVLAGASKQVREEIRARVDEMASRMDLVPREDFERMEIALENLRRRVETLEGGRKTQTGRAKASRGTRKGKKK